MLHQESTSLIRVFKEAGYKLRGTMSSLHKQSSKRTGTRRAALLPQQEDLHKQGNKRNDMSGATEYGYWIAGVKEQNFKRLELVLDIILHLLISSWHEITKSDRMIFTL